MNQTEDNSNNAWNHHSHWHWRGRIFWKIVLIIIVLVLISGFFHHETRNDNNGGLSNIPSISVSGHGEVLATPNIAEFSFTASDRETTVADAQNKMTAKANAAIDFLKKSGVDEKDIKTADYSVNPTYANSASAVVCPSYGPCGGGTPTINGYEVSETVSVKLRDTSKSGTILQGIGQIGVSNISGPNFTIDKPDTLQEQAREMAINKAKAQAEQLAKDLGVHLGKVLSFTESGNNPGPIPYAAKATLSSVDVAPAPPEIQPGQNKITSDVTITYEIK